MSNDIYKLFSEHKSNGDVKLREFNQVNYGQEFITESYNMKNLLDEIEKNGDKTKTYIVQKYRNNSIVYRNLGKNALSKYEDWNNLPKYRYCYSDPKNFTSHGDTTTTWERISFCVDKNKWKPTNFRYRDEVV